MSLEILSIARVCDNCQKLIFRMSLEIFIYIGELLSDYCFYDSTSLIKAHLDVGCGKHITEGVKRHIGDAYRANKFLEDSLIQKTCH
jgi:hypothetical protein